MMEAEKSLSFRLETFLAQLADLNRRWTDWLANSEAAAVGQDPQALLSLEPAAGSLFKELQQSLSDRQQILDDARKTGLEAPDLSGLAQMLPAWDKPAVRVSLLTARQQLANLRRLHLASWVLLSQVLNYYNDSLQLLMIGEQPHVYQQGSQTDTGGGRLLDASL